jgi:branched-chain amino acid transport system ATP-binding protein
MRAVEQIVMAVLDLQNVVSGYGDVEVLHGVSMDVDEDEIVCIVGPNGAGKSTLLKTVFGLVDCWSGSISLNGISTASASRVTRIAVS